MKYLLLTFALSFSCMSFAQTFVKISPLYPVSCENQSHSYVNKIFDIEQSETEQILEVRFKTIVFSCVGDNINIRSMLNPFAIAYNKGLLSIFRYEPEVQVDMIDHEAALVTMLIEKDRVFKKRDSRDYTYAFYPVSSDGTVFGARRMYMWNVYMFYDREFGTTNVEVK